MKVRYENLRGSMVEGLLREVLTPDNTPYYCSGESDRALELARKTAEAFGRLAERLVDHGVISLNDAAECVDFYGKLERM